MLSSRAGHAWSWILVGKDGSKAAMNYPLAEKGLDMGCMVEQGNGVERDDAKAAYRYKLAAHQRYAKAAFGLYYWRGWWSFEGLRWPFGDWQLIHWDTAQYYLGVSGWRWGRTGLWTRDILYPNSSWAACITEIEVEFRACQWQRILITWERGGSAAALYQLAADKG